MAIRGNPDFEYELAIRQNNLRRLTTLKRNRVRPCENALLYAVKQKREMLIPILIEAGSNPNEVNPYGLTALGYAVQHRDAETVQMLLEGGADANQDSFLCKPLTTAATWGKTETVKLLLGHGADPNGRDYSGLTALHQAKEYGYTEIIELLKKAGATALFRKPRRKQE